MLYNIIAIILALAAPKADPIDDARKAFSNCLFTLHNDNIKVNISLADFRKLADSGCTVEREAYHAIIVKSERNFGSNANEAAAYADEEVQAIISVIKTNYAENLDKGAVLTLEK